MPLWGATDSDESKPKNLTTAQKKQVFANASGWVLEAGSALSGNDNTSAQPEVLVAIGGLAESLGAADITEIEFITTAFDKSDGGTLQVRARFNEPVDVDEPLIVLDATLNISAPPAINDRLSAEALPIPVLLSDLCGISVGFVLVAASP